MTLRSRFVGAALLAATLMLSGCNPYPLPGRLAYGRCGPDAHTESYPLAKRERDAYGCKSDESGFLEGSSQGDARRN